MRLGLFGGTFDPIHFGHLILAEQCRETCALDRVWFVVAGAPPHKPGDRTAVAHRLEMVRIAIAGHPAFAVSEIETMRPGPHYSVETLDAVRRERPEDELFFLIGADSLADFPGWREPDRIARWPRSSWSIARAWPKSTRSYPISGRARAGRPGDDPADRDCLVGPPPPPGRRSEHPVHGARAASRPTSTPKGCIEPDCVIRWAMMEIRLIMTPVFRDYRR